MGFGISHQKAGLNRPGKYNECSRERRLADAWKKGTRGRGEGARGRHGDAETRRHGEHAKWRRITGITGAVEGVLTAKERRAGLKRLVERIKALATEHTENTERKQESKEVSFVQPWDIDADGWARAAGNSIESLCVELQISRVRLTMLTKEYCGLTVQELADGFRIRRVKRALFERLREAAQELWGLPGTLAAWKYEGYPMGNARGTPSPGVRFAHVRPLPTGERGTKRSRYFRMRAEDYAAEERGDERLRRIGELVECLRRNFDLEDWAARAGFASGARLKRACLNVLGRSLRAIERALAEEAVRYYICAEDKVLRQMACGDDNNPRVARARWIYHKSEDAPKEPFLDEWSKAAELARDWLDQMRAAFGCT